MDKNSKEKLTSMSRDLSRKESTSKPAELTGLIPQTESRSTDLCNECGGSGYFRQDAEPGSAEFGKLVKCEAEIHNVREFSRLSELSTMNPVDRALRLDDIIETVENKGLLAACREILATPYGFLYIYGGSGNAKSIALKALCNHFTLKGRSPVVYIKFKRLVDLMRDSFTEGSYRQKQRASGIDDIQNLGYLDRFERLKQIKVLAIDEFDKARATEFASEFRFDFLDERYEQAVRGETITLFAANSGPAGLPNALRSRINDGRFEVVENKAGDARPGLERDPQWSFGGEK